VVNEYSLVFNEVSTEAHLQYSSGTLCYRLRRLVEGEKTLEDPFYVSAAENSYAGERSYKTVLPLNKINISKSLVNVLTIFSINLAIHGKHNIFRVTPNF